MSTKRQLMERAPTGWTGAGLGGSTPALTVVAGASRQAVVALNADVLDKNYGPPDPDRAASALNALQASDGRGEWLRAGFAARAAGVTEEAFLAWCRTGGDKYTGVEDALKAWNSFDPTRPQGIGAGTLYMMARERGWHEPSGTSAGAGTSGPGAATTPQAANDSLSEGDVGATDAAISQLWVKHLGAGFRFNHSAKRWHHYRGGSWAPCAMGEQVESMKKLAALLLVECSKLLVSNPAGRDIKKLQACAQRAQSVQGIEAALKLAQSDPAIATSSDEFDTDPDLLNVANGVVHLPTGILMPHDPAQMMFRQVPAPLDANAACPEFLKFMDEVSCGDPDLVEFMQRSLGYALSGHASEEKLFFWLGKGANGKSVLANIVRHIMGTYAVTVPPAFMMQSRRDGGGATPELAMLAGARMALANEIEAGSRLSAQTVKVAVSTEHITARALYGSPFTFKPTHKLLIRGNHRPIVTDDDEGIWRRILLVPFDLNVAPQDRDPGLEARLIAEAPGILRWMVEGFVKWRQSGLKVAKRVTDASLAYRRESDLLEQWLSERCERGSAYTAQQRHAYGSYRRWCDEQGLRCFTKASFTRSLVERGIGTGREGAGERRETYTGLHLTPV